MQLGERVALLRAYGLDFERPAGYSSMYFCGKNAAVPLDPAICGDFWGNLEMN